MSKPRQQGPHGIPEFIDILSSEDRKLYDLLQHNVGSPEFRYNRNRRISTLLDIFECIREFCEHEEKDQWKRYLVCGMCWFKNCIAINTRQLKLLISKSKSAINGAFVKMGYQTIPTKGEEAEILLKKIPFLSHRYSDLRQWTIRRASSPIDEDQLDFDDFENQFDIDIDTKKSNEIETKKEIEQNKTGWIFNNSDFSNDEDPFLTYDYFNNSFKGTTEKEQEYSFVNFSNENYDSHYDFDFDYANPNVFTLMANPYVDIRFDDIKTAMKHSVYGQKEYNQKDFKSVFCR